MDCRFFSAHGEEGKVGVILDVLVLITTFYNMHEANVSIRIATALQHCNTYVAFCDSNFLWMHGYIVHEINDSRPAVVAVQNPTYHLFASQSTSSCLLTWFLPSHQKFQTWYWLKAGNRSECRDEVSRTSPSSESGVVAKQGNFIRVGSPACGSETSSTVATGAITGDLSPCTQSCINWQIWSTAVFVTCLRFLSYPGLALLRWQIWLIFILIVPPPASQHLSSLPLLWTQSRTPMRWFTLIYF